MTFSSTFICVDCNTEKPRFLAGYAGRCTVCQKKYYTRNPRPKRKDVRKTRQPKSLLRARDMWYKVHSYVPNWVKFEDFLPIYEEADRLGGRVRHIIPLKKDPNVCGLHTPKNLQISLAKSLQK